VSFATLTIRKSKSYTIGSMINSNGIVEQFINSIRKKKQKIESVDVKLAIEELEIKIGQVKVGLDFEQHKHLFEDILDISRSSHKCCRLHLILR